MPHPKSFAALREGDHLDWSHTVTEEEVDSFARLSGDTNPLHMDNTFARQHGFRGRVVHGMFVHALLSRTLGMYLPGPGVLWLTQESRFIQPVYIGDSITTRVTVSHKSEGLRSIVLAIKITNQRDETVLTGESRAMMLNINNMPPLNETTAIITGSSRGIGAAVAQTLGQAGIRTVVNYRSNGEAAQEVVRAVKQAGGTAIALQADISETDQCSKLVEEATAQFGPVTILVNNASPAIDRKPFTETTWEAFDNYYRTYIQSTFTLTQLLIPGMKEQGFGRIVNLLSSALVNVPPPGMTGYVTAKSALWGLTKSLAVDLAGFGITVNAISPSTVITEQWQTTSENRLRAMAMAIPLKRLATTQDVANAVLMLVSESGSYMTGINLPVAGGEVM